MKQISFAEAEFDPTNEKGRPRLGLAKMLRLYFVQRWYGLADEATEDAMYDSHVLRQFLGIDLARENRPMPPRCWAFAIC